MPAQPPTIFSATRKAARAARAAALARRAGVIPPASFLIDEICEDIAERLAFVRHDPASILVDRPIGAALHRLFPGASIVPTPGEYGEPFGPPPPIPPAGAALVASIAALDTVNDLPGALIHMRALLAPGGLAVAAFIGGASLPALRAAMFAAEPDRPAARLHPLIDPRSCPGLLGRAGWADPVVDSHRLTVRYSSLGRLVADLRAQGLGNVLTSPAPPLRRAGMLRAQQAFANQADSDGKVSETFEIITLTGRRLPLPA